MIFATFTGFTVGGLPGALSITVGMFLPAFAFSMIFFERLERIVDHPKLTDILNGTAAAVVGVIAATLLQFASVTVASVTDTGAAVAIIVGAVALIALTGSKLVTPLLIAGAGFAGWVLTP